MRSSMVAVTIAVALFLSMGAAAQTPAGAKAPRAEVSARTPQSGHVFVPQSSIQRSEDAGLRAHTNYVFHSSDGSKPKGLSAPQSLASLASGISPNTTEIAEVPESLGCLYVNSPSSAGCKPNYNSGSGGPSNAGWGAIALVDAYDNPDAASDIKAFDKYWKLKGANFTKVYANGNGDCSVPPPDYGWSVEESLDIEWAHVYAPKAAIVLVEACSSSYTDLLYAEEVAIEYIQSNYGGGQVSNSWGSGEFSGENSYDPIFAGWDYNYGAPTVTFASAGDSGCGAAYPSSNPWLVSAGGTSVLRNSDDSFNSEACWGGSGGGSSSYETYTASWTGSNTGPWADYQYPIFGESSRQTPDFASDADPSSGVYIYNQYDCGGWCVVGGTSVASPSLASIVNRSNNRLSTWYGYSVDGYGYFTAEENNLLYAQLPTATAYYKNFYDITTGGNGCTVTYNWDYCTGVGSPRGLLGK